MGADIRGTVDEVLRLTVALDATLTGKTVSLTSIYGVDGVDTGADESGDALSFPLTMDEGTDGVYSTAVVLESTGVYFAKVTMNGSHLATLIIRIVPSNFPTADARADEGITIVAVTRDGTPTLSLTITDSEGSAAGEDDNGDDLSMPLVMTQVTGHSDSWYYESVHFSEGGTYTLSMAGVSGPVRNDTIVVWEAAQTSASHFQGWNPDNAYSPSDWVSIGYLRRWTGWSVSEVSSSALKELRRLAIETFIEETGRWFPSWSGTWYGIVGQGDRLYLPMTLLTAQDGASDPEVVIHELSGEQTEVEEIDSANLIFRCRGPYAKQPYIEIDNRDWPYGYGVKITGDWGEVSPNDRRVPPKVKQVIVGLVRWHSLSFGQGSDGARDQATANRVNSESARDYSATYNDLAIGRGITGDPNIDRELVRLRIESPPMAFRS